MANPLTLTAHLKSDTLSFKHGGHENQPSYTQGILTLTEQPARDELYVQYPRSL